MLSNESKYKYEQAGAEMCQAHIKLWFGLAHLCLAWHMFGLAWLGVAWRGLVLFGIRVKLNYQISLLALDGWVGENETKAKPSLG